MLRHAPLTLAEREYIYQQKLKGVRLEQIAEELGCSYYTVRKWWRRGRDQGQEGLRQNRRGRPRRGILSTYPEAMRRQIQRLKCSHPRWGPDRIRVELAEDSRWQGRQLPSRSQIALYLKEACPEHVQRQRKRIFSPSATAGDASA